MTWSSGAHLPFLSSGSVHQSAERDRAADGGLEEARQHALDRLSAQRSMAAGCTIRSKKRWKMSNTSTT